MFRAKKIYFEYFKKTYEMKLMEYSKEINGDNELLDKNLCSTIKDFQYFVRIMTKIIIISYNLRKYHLIFKENSVTKDSIYNLVLIGPQISIMLENAYLN